MWWIGYTGMTTTSTRQRENSSIDRKRVQEWDQKYNELQRMNIGANAKRRKLNMGRTPLSPELDQRMFEFLEQERSEGRPVSNACLQAKAAEIGSSQRISAFKSSPGWLWRWKRNGVGMRCSTNSAQKVPADYADQLQHFRKSVITVRKAKNIDPHQIINMEQTICRSDMPSKRTNIKKGAKTVRIKTTRVEKKGFTVALAARADEPNFQR